MNNIKNKLKLTIEIPEIDPEIFNKRIIDGVPTLNKNIRYKSAEEFWKDLEEKEKLEEKKHEEKNKNIIHVTK